MSENYIDPDILANSDVSSENPSYPVENVYNKQRRSKVWRSDGYFNIENGSNTIIFTEGGANLTATITAGEYNSTADFMTALDTAFTSAPGAVGSYTITQSANFKFVITKGAGTFTIKWTNPSSADMAEILGFDTSVDSSGALSYTADVLKIHTNEWFLWDMGIASNPTDFILIGARNRAIKISPSATMKLQGNETDTWTNPSYEATLDYDDEAIIKFSDDGLHTEALRYWRLLLEDQNPLGYIEIGSLFLGIHYVPTNGSVQFPFQSSFIDRSTTVTAEGGQTFSDIKEKTQSYSLKWLNLSKDEIEDLTDIFNTYGTSVPFFISFDNNAVFSSSVNRRVKFVKFASEPTYELSSPDFFTMTMNLREEL